MLPGLKCGVCLSLVAQFNYPNMASNILPIVSQYDTVNVQVVVQYPNIYSTLALGLEVKEEWFKRTLTLGL